MILFLDYDGVLHPDAVYRRLNGQIELRISDELFMLVALLQKIIEEYPELRIVLSTSWVSVLGFRRARGYLPAKLAEQVIGATWRSAMGRSSLDIIEGDHQTRFKQNAACLHRLPTPIPWLAIDDNSAGWPSEQADALIQVDPMLGVSCRHVQKALVHQLEFTSRICGGDR
ncbi:MAG: HAD domain-containing protein [Rhodocyclaceae bacterium]|nr:HAD domain-containing protein [Rhodocyclaceae bacterium]